MNNPCVSIWPWDKAPEEYRAFSPHGGDEDYVAFIPNELAGDAVNELTMYQVAHSFSTWEIGCGWMDASWFCEWSFQRIETGIVAISAHA